MARAIAIIGTTVVLLRAAPMATAEPDRERVHTAAAVAGVDEIDLLGALLTVGQDDPREYLYGTGELQRPPPPLQGAVARADCIIGKESGGLDVPNRSGSDARGPGQYLEATWARHTSLYRQATGYAGALSLHSLADVRRVMSFMLAAYPGSRSEWTVGGC